MTQQIDPIQIKGLSSRSVDKLNNLANIQTIGNNLELTNDGTLNAVGGGGGGGGGGDVALYSALGSNTNGALTQKASTDLLVHAKPDGENDLIENNKITTGYLPDSVLGQVLYGGGFVPTTGVATLTANSKERLEVSTPTITLTNDTTSPTGYEANEGIYYIATEAGTFASISFQTGDWLISIGTSWSKVDNTDAVTGVKGANEQNYKLGNVNLSAQNVGAVSSTDAISTQSITPFVTTSMIADEAITTAKLDDEAVTTAKIDFTTSSVSISPARNITFASTSSIVKFGKIVVANLLFSSSSSIPTSGITIGTLPEGSRPLGTLTNTGWSHPNYTARCFVDTDGTVNFNPEVSVNANTNCGVSFVFIAS